MKRYFPVTHSTLSIQALIANVLPKYNLSSFVEGELISCNMNDTYCVEADNGNKYILRVYRSSWRSLDDILNELDILLYLKSQRAAVSIPLPRKDGSYSYITLVNAPEGKRYIVLFSYVPGEELTYKAEEKDSYLYGEMVAKIHTATEGFMSRHQRFNLDMDYLLDLPLKNIQHRLKKQTELWQCLSDIANRLQKQLIELPLNNLEWGYCHGDFHGWNAHLQTDGTLIAYDFDCGGMGWRAYDLAVFRWGARFRGREKERWNAFLKGYQSVRHIDCLDLKAILYFVALRHFWFLGVYAANGQDWGFGSLKWYFAQSQKFLSDLEQEYL